MARNLVIVALIAAATVWPGPAQAAMSGAWLSANDTYTPRDKFGLACVENGTALTAYVFGGRESSSTYVSDVYAYSTATAEWSNLYPVNAIDGIAAMAFAHINGALWAFAGQLPGDDVTNRVYSFDTTELEWSEISTTGPQPAARRRPGSWAWGDMLVSFGGLTGASATAQVYALNTTSHAWSLWHSGASSGTAPTARFDPCCVVVPGSTTTLCFGGTTALGDAADVWEFDNAARTWTERATTGTGPSARRLAMCAVHSGSLLVWAGWDSAAGEFVPDTALYVLSLSTWSWSSVAQPASIATRDSGAMCAGAGQVLLLGGARNSGRSNEVFRLDTSSLTFQLVSEGGVRPRGRSQHNSVTVGACVYVLMGYDGASYLNDVWRYDTTTSTWSELDTSAADATVGVPSGRAAACAASRGSSILVYGGRTASGESSELWLLNVDSGKWTRETTEGTSPGALAEHVCWLQTEDVLVVGAGEDADGDRGTSWFAYELTTQTWFAVHSTTGQAPEGRSMPFGYRMNTTHALVGLGIGAATYNDRWVLSDFAYAALAGRFEATWTQAASTLQSGESERNYIRGEAAVAGVASNALICGGALSSSFPSPSARACFAYNLQTGVNTPLPSGFLPVAAATAVQIGRVAYIFGGQLLSETVKRKVYVGLMQKFEISNTCALSQSDDSSCVHCSPGTLNPLCTPSGAGHYAPDAFGAQQQCLRGEYYGGSHATSPSYCVKCPASTYSGSPGSSNCTPCDTAVGCAIGSVSNSQGERTVHAFPDTEEQPKPLQALTVPWIVPTVACAVILALFIAALVTLHFTTQLSLRSLDIFNDGHREGFVSPGMPVVKTEYGGVVSLIALSAACAITMLLVLDFFYDNIDERKGSQPRPVINSYFPAEDVHADITLFARVRGPTRSVGSLSTVEDHCLLQTNTTRCRGTAGFLQTPKHVGSLELTCEYDASLGTCGMRAVCRRCELTAGSTTSFRFLFAPGLSAEVVDYSIETTTGISVPSVNDFTLDLVTDDEAPSYLQRRIAPPSGTVLSGFPASRVTVELTPTYFISPASTLYVRDTQENGDGRHRATGYHADQAASATVGNTVDEQEFGQYFGVPVTFDLAADSTALLVERSLRSSLLDLVSAILGSVSGILAAALIGMQVFDKRWFKRLVGYVCGRGRGACCRCLSQDLDEYRMSELNRVALIGRYHPNRDYTRQARHALYADFKPDLEVHEFFDRANLVYEERDVRATLEAAIESAIASGGAGGEVRALQQLLPTPEHRQSEFMTVDSVATSLNNSSGGGAGERATKLRDASLVYSAASPSEPFAAVGPLGVSVTRPPTATSRSSSAAVIVPGVDRRDDMMRIVEELHFQYTEEEAFIRTERKYRADGGDDTELKSASRTPSERQNVPSPTADAH